MIEEITIDKARQQLADCQAELDRARSLMRDLLSRAGEPATCAACGDAVWFVLHVKTGKKGIYNQDGLSHYATCTDPERFRKRRGDYDRSR